MVNIFAKIKADSLPFQSLLSQLDLNLLKKLLNQEDTKYQNREELI
jgi:hypothetical protein